jgi:hypothetical protein
VTIKKPINRLGVFQLNARKVGNFFLRQLGFRSGTNYNQGKLEGAIEEILMETSKQINVQLPIMVDKETRLDTTMCVGKHMSYKYTMINLSEKDIEIRGALKMK